MTRLLSPEVFFVLSAGLVIALMAISRPVIGLILAIVVAIAVDFATHDLALVGFTSGVIILRRWRGSRCASSSAHQSPGTAVTLRLTA